VPVKVFALYFNGFPLVFFSQLLLQDSTSKCFHALSIVNSYIATHWLGFHGGSKLFRGHPLTNLDSSVLICVAEARACRQLAHTLKELHALALLDLRACHVLYDGTESAMLKGEALLVLEGGGAPLTTFSSEAHFVALLRALALLDKMHALGVLHLGICPEALWKSPGGSDSVVVGGIYAHSSEGLVEPLGLRPGALLPPEMCTAPMARSQSAALMPLECSDGKVGRSYSVDGACIPRGVLYLGGAPQLHAQPQNRAPTCSCWVPRSRRSCWLSPTKRWETCSGSRTSCVGT
jgi:hypothetical protein